MSRAPHVAARRRLGTIRIGWTLVALWASLAAAVPARAEVGAYLLFDMADGRVLASHRATTPWYPASITKLMTAYVTFKAIESGKLTMTSPVTISPQARQQPPSRMGFALGTVITVETALRIILTKSANDVSVALAEAVGGTTGQFVERMNATAAEIGMASSSFDNPHGLPNQKQLTTARDIAVLMRALAENFPQYADYFSMGGVQLGNQTLRNHNKLIRTFRGADGMKTGFICASGFNLAASATRDGVRLGAVVLGGITSQERDERTAELLAKGFEAVEAGGGAIALDDFGSDERLDYAAVTGETPDLGTVDALPAASEPVADIRNTVCGASRPVTRYSEGVVKTREALEAQREAVLAWRAESERREREKAAVLARARVEPEPPAPPAEPVLPQEAATRTFGDELLRPVSWESASLVVFPAPHPRVAETRPRSDFAPDGWVPSRSLPAENPLQSADLREPLPPEPEARPLSYMQPTVLKAPVRIAIGGADPTRPDPLSGTVVGGGRAPLPEAKPKADPEKPDDTVAFKPIREDVTEYAAEIREAVTQSQ